MQITKKLEQEILEVYNGFLDSYARGDWKKMVVLFDDNVKLIGSSEGEVYKNKKQAAKYYRDTAGEVAGKIEQRNRHITVSPVAPHILVEEICDLYIKSGRQWVFYNKIRISTVFRKTAKGWKLFHQHASVPDALIQGKETIAFKKIAKENRQLQEAVKRRTAELEFKNHELQIEAALEKVRAVAMGMKQREDMLKICKSISHQLNRLGVKGIRNVQTAIFYPGRSTYLNYEYYQKHDKTIVTEVNYTTHKIQLAFAKRMMKGTRETLIEHFRGKKLQDWYAHQKSTNQFLDKYLLKADSLNYYFYSIGPVALGISTYFPLSAKEMGLFNRFLKVFELAYQKFLEIEKAQARVREAQIEAALERVRSRSMAMQHSGELAELVSVMFKELTKLGFSLTSCIIWINDEVSETNTLWVTSARMNRPAQPILLKPFHHSFFQSIIHAWKEKDPKWVFTLQGKQKKSFEKSFFAGIKELPAALKNALTVPEKVVFSASFNHFGALEIIGTEALTDEKFDILHRFGKVFDNSYTRFNDLIKAEAQARETEIQLALERVRSRTMAMHSSEELASVASVLFHQLLGLNLTHLRRCLIGIVDEKNGKLQSWHTSLKGDSNRNFIDYPVNEHPVIRAKIRGWRKQKPFSISLSPAKLKDFIQYITKHGFEYQQGEKPATRLIQNHIPFRYGYLEIATHEPIQAEDFRLLQRFAGVFEQTYTRFLDLQKAESQAREAEIQLGLERVRARTMAMHQSDELLDIIMIVSEQLHHLHLKFLTVSFGINNSNYDMKLWMAVKGYPKAYQIQWTFIDNPGVTGLKKAQENPDQIYADILSPEDNREWLEHIIACNPGLDIFSAENQAYLLNSPGYARSIAIMRNIFLVIGNYAVIPYTEEENQVLKKFAQVFEQAYTRFLDLQKAEEQARESEIQLALERVRARTMAMQKSEEMAETAAELFKQFSNLGQEMMQMTIGIIHEKERVIEFSVTDWSGSGEAVYRTFNLSIDEPALLHKIYEAWKAGKRSAVTELTGEELENWISYRNRMSGVTIQSGDTHGRRAITSAFFSKGNLSFSSPERPAPETIAILERFAAVFDGTYTRFLDLQKAEAQAREAQVEAALERVRSRTMGMQHSNELQEAAVLLFRQVIDLGVPAFGSGFNIWEEDRKHATAWMAGEDRMQPPFKTSSSDDIFLRIYEAAQRGDSFFVEEQGGETLKSHYEYMNSIPVFKQIADKMAAAGQTFPTFQIMHCAFFSHGYLMFISFEPVPGAYDIFKRFAKVFEQTYRRFLDLKKAEAQAREAQIEAALEKIRSRSLAMQKTGELKEVVLVIVEKLKDLGVVLDANGVVLCTYFNDSRDVLHWIASPDFSFAGSYLLPYFDHPIFRLAWESKERGDEYFSKAFTVEEKNSFFEYAFAHSDYRQFPDEFKKWVFQNDKHSLSFAWQKNSAILIPSHTGVVPSPDDVEILKRFARVFEQSYIRFMDLQKAEAQAREAQIEAALERVRSRSIGMQKSEELKEVIQVVYQQIVHLKINADHAGFVVDYTPKGDWHFWIADQREIPSKISHPYFDSAWAHQFEDAREKGTDFFTTHLNFEEKNKFYNELLAYIPALPEASKDFYLSCPGLAATTAVFDNVSLYMENFSGIPYTDEENKILLRFGKVFQQTYTRFLDLQKAEAQARESEIQLALERIRARTMAMQKSDELLDVIAVFSEQLSDLKIQFDHVSFGVNILENDFKFWLSTAGNPHPIKVHVPYVNNPAPNRVREAHEKGIKFFADILTKEENRHWIQHLITHSEIKDYPDKVKDFLLDSPGYARSTFLLKNINFYVGNYRATPYSDEENNIFHRFSLAFEQSYTRFLDLQRAEEQAREAQIEAALERVRSKTMAMHNSQEVGETVITLFDELVKLGLDEVDRCGIGIMQDHYIMEAWTASKKEETAPGLVIGHIDMSQHALLQGTYEAWRDKKESFQYVLEGEEVSRYFTIINNQPGYKARLDIATLPPTVIQNTFYFREGGLYVFSGKPLLPETANIFKRFAGVFGQTYRRYLDLVKAEAQAREAQIEASLEKVRSRAMAMHNSADLSSAASIVFTELRKIGLNPFRSGISLHNTENRKNLLYTATQTTTGDELSVVGWALLDNHPVLSKIYDSWAAGEDYFPELKGELLKSYYEIIAPTFKVPEEQSTIEQYGYFIAFTHGALYGWARQPVTEEQRKILKRFASVVDLTFKRYFDLQKAEEQAREAQVEAALEKVRGKAMAMHDSNELTATAGLVFTELRNLGVHSIRCGVGIINKETKNAQIYSAISSGQGDTLGLIGGVDLTRHPVMYGFYTSFIQNEEYFPELTGEAIWHYYEALSQGLSVPVPETGEEQKEYGISIPISIGCLYAWSGARYEEEQLKIIRRFASIIDLTFRRYLELQKAEANAKEAVKQAALDRIRADIASMRTLQDLDRITPLIWNELTILGIPFIRCGVFIMDDSQQTVHTFLSTPDGKAIAAFHLPYGISGKTGLIIENWHKHTTYIDHWNDSDFSDFARTLVEQHIIQSSDQYLGTVPHGGFYLHFFPFLQGMLYVGNTTRLEEEAIDLIQSVAYAFSTAYARYEDFTRLEAAKKQVDSTLSELQATQRQLIQSEKMASLGEMTAGIAHEIQNPLNFVNNFSDVSNELLGDMKSELEKGNLDDALAIAEDVRQNLGKILFHGRRADGIVKSMLQHSRTGSGKKEPTDINALIDEYLRLAFHGLRAKDKSFNAKFETHFDPAAGKISIMAQDIGRVILNLINNAFHAVTEKKKNGADGYDPTVTVSTNNRGGWIEIAVKDNGGGMPQKILDKIFQPFFTTKPTGQGTGLGLSLSYDIVKAHGGEIKVETNEGEGTAFFITLPIS